MALTAADVPAAAFPAVIRGQSPVPGHVTTRWVRPGLVVRFAWAQDRKSRAYRWEVARVGTSLADVEAQDRAAREAEITRERKAWQAKVGRAA